MTEAELRSDVVNVMRGWLGWSEKNGKYKSIIDLYNTQDPLPRGYPVKYTDEWCATTVTAAGMAAGLHDIVYGECSCGKMVALYQSAGRWQENDAYRPQPGDIIMYYWKDGANYATTDCTGSPNHVGIVEQVVGNTITVIEGNKGEAVARRTLSVNSRYIRGYCLPDYASKAESEVDEIVSYDDWKKYMEQYLTERRDNDSSTWSQQARDWAIKTKLVSGGGTMPDGTPNYMWEDLPTREQLVQTLYTFAKLFGLA